MAAAGSYLKTVSADGTRSYSFRGVRFLAAVDVKRLFPESIICEGKSETCQIPALELNKSAFVLEGAGRDSSGVLKGYEISLAAPFSARFFFSDERELFAASGCLLIRDRKRGSFIISPEMRSSLRVASVFRPISLSSVRSFTAISSWKSNGFGDFVLLMLPKMARIAGAKQNGRLMFSSLPSYLIQYCDLLQLERPVPNVEIDKLIPVVEFADVIFGPGVIDGFVPLRSDIDKLVGLVTSSLPKSPHKRIYLRREGRRKIANEEELLPLFRRLGFKIIGDQHTDVLEQAALFREADVIVSPHGALLANLAFCRPGTMVVELFPGAYGAMCYRPWRGRWALITMPSSAQSWSLSEMMPLARISQ